MNKAESQLCSLFIDENAIAERLEGEVLCEKPNNAIYKFEGNIKLTHQNESQMISLNAENLLLRGSSLRNTEYVYGVVVFTGHDTKVMQNLPQAKFKFSTLEKITNQAIVIVMSFSVVASIIGSIFGSSWTYSASLPI
jgi:magnesium-transporting ATPase (P-type)